MTLLSLTESQVETKWADRQFTLNSHIANKIVNNGASRNIMIRSARGRLSPQGIREDMEHIHNLVIVDIQFRGNDAYVATNSVHNALFARTCMMSRSAYKGCRVEFCPDECDVPLPERRLSSRPTANGPVQSKKITNRFGLLNFDGTENGSDDVHSADDGESETLEASSNFGVRLDFLD